MGTQRKKSSDWRSYGADCKTYIQYNRETDGNITGRDVDVVLGRLHGLPLSLTQAGACMRKKIVSALEERLMKTSSPPPL